MRNFKIVGEHEIFESLNMKKFIDEIENDINNNPEIIESAKNCNREFAEKVREILSDEENILYSGTMIEALTKRMPRYHFIKNQKFNGTEYDVQIDFLTRSFALVEI